MPVDVIATLAGAVDNKAVAAALAGRADLMAASQANYQAVMAPDDPGGLSAEERRALACRIAMLNGDAPLAKHYVAGLGAEGAALADPDAPSPADARLAAMLRHVDLVTRHPREATRADIAALAAAGLATADIVRLSQVIAFVNYQLRVIAGLRLIGGVA
jgi:CMD domain protein